MPTKHSHARQGYLEWYSHLSSTPELDNSDRDPGEQALDILQHRLDGFNFASEELLRASQTAFVSENHHMRAAGVECLLHQIEGDLRAAQLMWDVIDAAGTCPEDEVYRVSSAILKNRQMYLQRLAYQIPGDLNQLASEYSGGEDESNRSQKSTLMLQDMLDDLREEIDDTTTLIFPQVNRTGLTLVRGILQHSDDEWNTINEGIDLLRGSQKAGSVGWGLEDEVPTRTNGLAGELRTTLVNIIERILIIIENNDLVRYTIADWLDDLRDISGAEQRENLHTLIEHLYQAESFRQKHLDNWLAAADEPRSAQVASREIHLLADNFLRLANQIARIGKLSQQGTLFRQPLLASTGYALQVGLLGILIFAGYDHIDEGAHALNITRGIKEILISEFKIPRQMLHRLSGR